MKLLMEQVADPHAAPRPDFMSVEFEEFMYRVKANDWVHVLCRLRNNKAYGLHPDMQEDKPLLDMPSFSKRRLERRNGTDCLNARDDLGRTALEVAFEYKAYETASVLLKYGAKHPANEEQRAQRSEYAIAALKESLYGYGTVNQDLVGFKHAQLMAIQSEVNPALDLLVYDILKEED